MIILPSTRGVLQSASGGDPAFSTVVNLTHFDGSNGAVPPYTNNGSAATGFTTVVAGGALTTSISKFGVSSYNGTPTPGRHVYVIGGGSAYTVGTNDFTYEFWVYPLTLNIDYNSVKVYFDTRTSTGTGSPVVILYTPVADGSLRMNTGSDVITSAAGVITAAAWNAIAVSRASGTTRLFVNGTQVGSSYTDSNSYAATGQIYLGSAYNNGGGCLGYFDEFRFSNGSVGSGAGRYTANYTPETAAFPDS